MSDWKKIGKSSYDLSIGKFAEWAPSHPFTIPYQGPKISYSEGDEITDVTDPVFDIDFTGQPLSDQHFPCGYWYKNYIPPYQIIYTSLPYPIEFSDNIEGISLNIVKGDFNGRIDHYIDIIDSVNSTGLNVSSGNFKATVLYINSHDYVASTALNITSGIFKAVIHDYSITDSIDSKTMTLVSGIFKDVVINYTYWIPAKIQDLGISILGGSHAN